MNDYDVQHLAKLINFYGIGRVLRVMASIQLSNRNALTDADFDRQCVEDSQAILACADVIRPIN